MASRLSPRPGEPLAESPDSGAPPTGGAGAPADSPAPERAGLLSWPYSKALMAGALATHLLGLLLLAGFAVGNLIFELPIAAPALILAALAVTKGKPGFYLGAAVTLPLVPLLFLGYAPQYLLVPQFGPLFAGAVFALLSVALGAPAGIWVWRHRKEDVMPMALRDGLRTRGGVATVLVAGLFLGAIVAGQAAWIGGLSSPSVGADFEPTVRLTITEQNYHFVPDQVSFPAGQLVELTLDNKDPDYHTLTYTVANKTYNHDLLPSTASKILVLITDPGEYPFWCIPHTDFGMHGVFHVT